MADPRILLLFDALKEQHVEAIQAAAPGARIRVERDEAGIRAALPEAHIVFGWPRVQWLSEAVTLRWLHLPSAGAEQWIADRTLRERGVVITNSRGVFGIPIAEHILALMLAMVRRLPDSVRNQSEKAWRRPKRIEATFGFDELHGQTLGILGLGDIGSELARRAKAFGMRVVAMRRRSGPAPDGIDALYGPEGVDAVIQAADFLAICLPLTPATVRILSAERIRTMKQGARVINVGRGALIDEAALIEALRDGHLGGAGLDVFVQEPLPPESPLWELPGVIITPHVAGSTPRHADRTTEIFCRNLQRFARGEPLTNVVDWEAGY